MNIGGITIPEGISLKAQRQLVEGVIPMIVSDPIRAHRRLFFAESYAADMDENNAADKALYSAIWAKIDEAVVKLPPVEGDFVCHTHQQLASHCGCLDEYLRNRCSCGMKMVWDGGGYACPECEFQALMGHKKPYDPDKIHGRLDFTPSFH